MERLIKEIERILTELVKELMEKNTCKKRNDKKLKKYIFLN